MTNCVSVAPKHAQCPRQTKMYMGFVKTKRHTYEVFWHQMKSTSTDNSLSGNFSRQNYSRPCPRISRSSIRLCTIVLFMLLMPSVITSPFPVALRWEYTVRPTASRLVSFDITSFLLSVFRWTWYFNVPSFGNCFSLSSRRPRTWWETEYFVEFCMVKLVKLRDYTAQDDMIDEGGLILNP